jgi:DNA mismatch endonuclease, patch repair protein
LTVQEPTSAPTRRPRPVASSPEVTARFSRQRRRDTQPEVALRRELHRRGLRFVLHVPVPGFPRRTVDIAFPRRRVAVFVDGCFWHRCPEHATHPAANATWWRSKLDTNHQRDIETNRALESHDWLVVRIWEHEATVDAADKVEAFVRARR